MEFKFGDVTLIVQENNVILKRENETFKGVNEYALDDFERELSDLIGDSLYASSVVFYDEESNDEEIFW